MSGNSHHGVVIDATPVDDRFGSPGGAYLFDGVSSEIILSNNMPFIDTPEFTISAWARIDGLGGGSHGQNPIFTHRDDAATMSTSKSTIVLFGEWQDSTEIDVRTSVTASGEFISAVYSTPSTGAWHHYAATYDRDSVKLYIDGITVSSAVNDQTGDLSTSIDHVTIGTHRFSGGGLRGAFNGAIDDVRIFDCALSPTEITGLYTAIAELAPSELPRCWPNPLALPGRISCQGLPPGSTVLTLFDMRGQPVFTSYLHELRPVQIPAESLSRGPYLLRLQNESHILSSELIAVQ